MWGACDSQDNPLVPEFARCNPRALELNELLRRGVKLGFTGGGDCHEGHAGFSSEDPEGQGRTPHTFAAILYYRCGLTAALLPQLGRAELVEALRQRRTYATTGARILLEFSVSGLAMGAAGSAPVAHCSGTVHGVAPVRAIEVVKDGEVVWSQAPGQLDARFEWRDPAVVESQHSYYLHVLQVDGQQAWSSPVWVGLAE